MRGPTRTIGRTAAAALLVWACGLGAQPAIAQAGGTGDRSGEGGLEFGAPSGVAAGTRPVATTFRVAPRSIRAGSRPRVVLRVDEPGVSRVSARLVFWPLRGRGTLKRVALGRVRVGRVVRPSLGRLGLAKGRYEVRLHVRDGYGQTLRRRSGRTGRARLDVRAEPAAPAPAPVPSAPGASGGVFPVSGPSTIGDGFGADRGDHRHEGADIAAPSGAPVVAPTAGRVTRLAVQDGGAGWYVVMDAADGRSFFFAHCVARSWAVREGDAVAPGQRLCSVGSTGASSGPHLHFEIWVGGWRASKASRAVDPMPQLLAWRG